MTYLNVALNEALPFEGPVFPQGNLRRTLLGAAATGFGALTAASAIAALAAAWTITASITANSDFDLKTPTAPKTITIANPYGTLEGAAQLSASRPAPIRKSRVEAEAETPAMPPPARHVPDFSHLVPLTSPIEAEATPPLPPAAPALAPARSVPLPPRHPVFLPATEARREALRQTRAQAAAPPAQETTPQAAPSDNLNPLQRFFAALTQSSGSAAEQPSRNDEGQGFAFPFGASRSLPGPGSRYALYDISTHTVYLPDGERLEAHSGLGALIDDPSHVNAKDRGATPPNVYDLQLRKQMFHGVAALRLNPVGSGQMYGRVGLLAHSFMLGPNGQSNGCVSFREYPRFLQAYTKGEITQLMVVAHLGDAPARVASDRRSMRYASN